MPMEMPAPDPKALKAYEAIADDLSAVTPTQRTKMMGMPSLKAHGKMFAGLWGANLVFKLSGDSHAEALAIKGAHLFDPSGQKPSDEGVGRRARGTVEALADAREGRVRLRGGCDAVNEVDAWCEWKAG